MLKSDVNQITAGAGAVLARQLEADITGSDRFVSQSSTEKRARVTTLQHRRQVLSRWRGGRYAYRELEVVLRISIVPQLDESYDCRDG
jgi:hypothetical protein